MKPNIGHLEAGAGLAGLIKTVLTLEAGVIPPNINFVTANPKLRLEDYNFVIATEPTPWPTQGLRRASVNSFGYGGRYSAIFDRLITQPILGTNGHCILDDAYHYLDERGIIGQSHTILNPRLEINGTITVHSGTGSDVRSLSVVLVLATDSHNQY